MISVGLAVVAAVLFGFGAVLQQSSARTTALRHGTGRARWLPVLRVLGRLVRNRSWLLGWTLNAVGFGCHVLALHLGAIAAVQSVLVMQLLFALLISARRRSLRPTPRDWVGASAVCAGVVTLVLLRGGVSQQQPSRGAVGLYVAVIVTAMASWLTAGRLLRRHAQTRTALVAVASGMCFSTTAVLLVVITSDIAQRGLVGAFGLPLLGLVASATAGTLLVQDAFASGSMPTALTATTITDPVCSAVAGAVLFDAMPPAGLELFLGLPGAGALVVTGVVLLATSATLHDERHLGAQAQAGAATSPAWRDTSSPTVRSHG
ncbi:MAG TPA: DMT family transporter [Micromonosporaceae bacterium]|jgi:drug/metabolite transporter (DMT)-like permease